MLVHDCSVLRDACDTVCGCTFCRACILKWLDKSRTCPIDRKFLRVTCLRPTHRLIKSLLDGLRLRCPHHREGCPEVLRLEAWNRHVAICVHGGGPGEQAEAKVDEASPQAPPQAPPRVQAAGAGAGVAPAASSRPSAPAADTPVNLATPGASSASRRRGRDGTPILPAATGTTSAARGGAAAGSGLQAGGQPQSMTSALGLSPPPEYPVPASSVLENLRRTSPLPLPRGPAPVMLTSASFFEALAREVEASGAEMAPRAGTSATSSAAPPATATSAGEGTDSSAPAASVGSSGGDADPGADVPFTLGSGGGGQRPGGRAMGQGDRRGSRTSRAGAPAPNSARGGRDPAAAAASSTPPRPPSAAPALSPSPGQSPAVGMGMGVFPWASPVPYAMAQPAFGVPTAIQMQNGSCPYLATVVAPWASPSSFPNPVLYPARPLAMPVPGGCGRAQGSPSSAPRQPAPSTFSFGGWGSTLDAVTGTNQPAGAASRSHEVRPSRSSGDERVARSSPGTPSS
jgi:hypothetical protein